MYIIRCRSHQRFSLSLLRHARAEIEWAVQPLQLGRGVLSKPPLAEREPRGGWGCDYCESKQPAGALSCDCGLDAWFLP